MHGPFSLQIPTRWSGSPASASAAADRRDPEPGTAVSRCGGDCRTCERRACETFAIDPSHAGR